MSCSGRFGRSLASLIAPRPCTGDKLEAAKKACAVLKKEKTEARRPFNGWQAQVPSAKELIERIRGSGSAAYAIQRAPRSKDAQEEKEEIEEDKEAKETQESFFFLPCSGSC